MKTHKKARRVAGLASVGALSRLVVASNDRALLGIDAPAGALGVELGEALERLKMCGDCRVVDIYSNPSETQITDL